MFLRKVTSSEGRNDQSLKVAPTNIKEVFLVGKREQTT